MKRLAISVTLPALLAACGGPAARTDASSGLSCPPCPFQAVCVGDPIDACDPAVARCPGICVAPVACGGIAGIPCPAGQVCVDDPRDACVLPGGVDCPGLCAPAQCPPGACGPPLGMPSWICPDGSVAGPTGRCLASPGGGCGWEVRWCDGTACGAIGGAGCPGGQVCVSDPRNPCDPAAAACAGVCVTPVFCGGIAGIPCPAGRTCVDDPRDGCAPPAGADCGGLCAPAG